MGVQSIYPKLDPKSKPLAEFCLAFAGQHDVPWLVLSALMAYSGAVSKEYVLASAVNYIFLTFDVACRVLWRCEEHGGKKEMIIPYIPMCVVMGLLSVLTYKAMGAEGCSKLVGAFKPRRSSQAESRM